MSLVKFVNPSNTQKLSKNYFLSINSPLIIAHRGGRYWSSKNFEYIKESIAQGADVIELDVFKSKKGEYIVGHTKLSLSQGLLEDALKLLNNIPLYVDIKDKSINPNHLIKFIMERTSSPLIVGSFYSSILKKITMRQKILISYHLYNFHISYKKIKEVSPDWVVLWGYNFSDKQIKFLSKKGIRVAPCGNLIKSKQKKSIFLGANAVFVYDVAKFKKYLSKSSFDNSNSMVSFLEQYCKKFNESCPVIFKFRKNTFFTKSIRLLPFSPLKKIPISLFFFFLPYLIISQSKFFLLLPCQII